MKKQYRAILLVIGAAFLIAYISSVQSQVSEDTFLIKNPSYSLIKDGSDYLSLSNLPIF